MNSVILIGGIMTVASLYGMSGAQAQAFSAVEKEELVATLVVDLSAMENILTEKLNKGIGGKNKSCPNGNFSTYQTPQVSDLEVIPCSDRILGVQGNCTRVEMELPGVCVFAGGY